MTAISSSSIVNKIRQLILTTAVVAVVVSGTFVITSEYFLFRDNFIDNITSVAEVVSINVTAPLVFDNEDEGRQTLASLGAVSGIQQGHIVDKRGEVFASYVRPGMPGLDISQTIASIPYGLTGDSGAFFETVAGNLLVAVPINLDQETIATLVIRASFEEIYARLQFQSMILVLILVVAMLVAILSGSQMQKFITGPLELLAYAMRDVTNSREYSIRLEKQNTDEIGVLVDGFNEMLAQIQQRDEKLASANDSLESEVQLRTRELETANDELQTTLEAVEHAKDRAEAANRAKSAFLATMSHEIRTPINGLLGNTELLLNEDLGVQAREYGEIAYRSGEALLDIINDILDFSRIEAGKLELNEKPFRIDQLIQELCLSLAPVIRQKRLDLQVDVEGAPDQVVLGDHGRVRQVVSNLITNAMKFTEQGAITVKATHVLRDEHSDFITTRIEVSDTGIGIAADQQKTIFDRFEQVDNTFERTVGGTGLGLAICKELVNRMGGEIGVSSTPGVGSTFWFEIPFRSSDQRVAPIVTEAELLKASMEQAPCRALVVDDSEINRDMAFNMLKVIGCQTDVGKNGQEAIDLASATAYDLILMDCQMPEIDGFRATRRIRSEETDRSRRPAFIVALTANAIKGDRERCLQAGMSEYLAKPFKMDELRTMVAAAIDLRRISTIQREVSDLAVLDQNVLNNIRALEQEGSEGLLARYVGMYLHSAPDLLDAITAGYEARNGDALTFASHSLKSESAPLGATKLSQIAKDLEEKGRNNRFEGVQPLIAAAQKEFHHVERALVAELEETS